MQLLGYLLYFGFVFFPGISIGEILGVFQNRETLTERLAFAFCLGVAIDTIVMAVRTSGVGGLSGIDLGTIEAVIVVGAVALLLIVGMKRKLTFSVRPKSVDLVVLATMAALGIMLLVYFQKYPIFPEYDSYDFSGHVYNVQSIISGQYTTIPAGILYYGVHYQLAAAYLLAGGNILISIRTTMAILVVLSVPVFYFAALKLFSSKKAALIVIMLYVSSGAIWFGSVFDSGLYPNFFGVIISLFFVGLFLDLQVYWGWKSWAAFLITLPALYLSHYTTVTIIPALLILPLVQILSKRKDWKRLLLPPIVLVAPMVVVAATRPSVVSLLLSLLDLSGGTLQGGTFLSGALSFFPVVSYMATEVDYDLGFVLMCVFVGIFVWKGIGKRLSPAIIPAIWFVSLLALAPLSLIAWRFSYEALVPFTLMAGCGISFIVPSIQKSKKGRIVSGSYWKIGLVLTLVLGVTVAGSWGPQMVSDALTETSAVANSQNAVYSAILWLQTNTPANSTYLSVSDWRFTFTEVLLGRYTYYEFASTPKAALGEVNGSSVRYIIVTNLVTFSLPPVPSDFPWNNFPTNSSSTLSLIYSNSDVRIYHILT